MFLYSRIFLPVRTTKKVVFHLLSNRIFRDVFVNGKQPLPANADVFQVITSPEKLLFPLPSPSLSPFSHSFLLSVITRSEMLATQADPSSCCFCRYASASSHERLFWRLDRLLALKNCLPFTVKNCSNPRICFILPHLLRFLHSSPIMDLNLFALQNFA